MPGFILHFNATVLCAHGGKATPASLQPKVLVSTQPIALAGAPWVVAGCPLPPPPGANGPCVTAQFATASLRVKSFGVPLLLFDSQATCVPTGTPLPPPFRVTQTRVVAT
jgi:hypothetical protein